MYIHEGRDVYMWRPRRIYVEAATYIRRGDDVWSPERGNRGCGEKVLLPTARKYYFQRRGSTTSNDEGL